MVIVSARDRKIEILLLATWSLLLVWALVARFGSDAAEPVENGFLLMLVSAICASVSQLIGRQGLRWSLMGISLLTILVALVLTFR